MNNPETIKLFTEAILTLKLQNHLLPGTQTSNFLIRLRDKNDYTKFEKLYKNLNYYVLKQKTQKIRFSTLIDLILSNIIFK